jgi:hypothetical protein
MNLFKHRKTESEFSKETLKMILKEVAETGQVFDAVADRYRLAPMYIMDGGPGERNVIEGEELTLEQFKEKYPHRRVIVIKTRE